MLGTFWSLADICISIDTKPWQLCNMDWVAGLTGKYVVILKSVSIIQKHGFSQAIVVLVYEDSGSLRDEDSSVVIMPMEVHMKVLYIWLG